VINSAFVALPFGNNQKKSKETAGNVSKMNFSPPRVNLYTYGLIMRLKWLYCSRFHLATKEKTCLFCF
jgi:hypothetical protein